MKRTLTTTEVADIFGIARQTVDAWVDLGVLRKVKLGEKSFITGASVVKLIEKFDDVGNIENRIQHLKRDFKEKEEYLNANIEKLTDRLMFYSDSTAYGLAKTLKILFGVLANKGECTERNYEIVKSILEGGTANEISERYGYTPERVRQIARQMFSTLERIDKYSELVEENDILKDKIKYLEELKLEDKRQSVAKDIPDALLCVLNTNIRETPLSNRAINVLLGSLDVETVHSLIKLSADDIVRARCCGVKTALEIVKFVESLGLKLGTTHITEEVVKEWESNQ